MACLSPEDVVLFLQHALPPRERAAAEQHIDVCARCRRVIAVLAATSLVPAAPEERGDDPAGWLNDFLEPGARIGRYVLEARAGQGAMGVVYRAHDPDLRRAVAIKLVRSSSATDGKAERRLLREAQALARLSEPHVMPIYDVGVHAGRVFIVMEYVYGESLRERVARTNAGHDDIVELYAAAGRGLAAAHAAGLVHRDFKPDNVLITADGRVLVTDFGMAGLHQGAPTGRDEPGTPGPIDAPHGQARLTRTGSILGTPAYMSPEQLDGREAIPASDQFSFCVALFEALAGQRPFGGDTPAAVRERIDDGVAAERERPVPLRLRPILRRGLAPDPKDRHASMTELLRRLGRRRRRASLVLGAGVIAGGVVLAAPEPPTDGACDGFAAKADALWGESRREQVRVAFERTELPHAPAAYEHARVALDGFAERWRQAAGSVCDGERPPEIACIASARERAAAMIAVLADADAKVVERSADAVATLEDPGRCAGRETGPPQDLQLRRLLADAAAEFDAGRIERAHAIADEALVRAQARGQSYGVARALRERGRAAALAGRTRAAIDDLTAAYSMAIAADGMATAADAATALAYMHGYEAERPTAGYAWARHAEAALQRLGSDAVREAALANSLAAVRAAARDHAGALAGYTRALELWDRAGRTHDLRAITSASNMGNALQKLGRHDEAIAAYRGAIDSYEAAGVAWHPAAGRNLVNLGNAHVNAGEYDEAKRVLETAVSVLAETLGPRAPMVGQARGNLANALLYLGDLPAAEQLLAQAQEIYEAAYGPDHTAVARTLIGRAAVEHLRADFPRARAHLIAAAAILERVGGRHHVQLGNIAYNLGKVAGVQGDFAEARRQLERAATVWAAALHPKHPRVAEAAEGVAAMLIRAGEPEEALRWLERAAAIRAEHADPATGADSLLGLRGAALLGLGRLEEAETLLRASLVATDMAIERAPTAFALARTLVAMKRDRAEAIDLARSARDWFADAGPAAAMLHDEVETWLVCEHRPRPRRLRDCMPAPT